MEIGCIVEGDGEENAVPLLIRRIVSDIDPALYVQVNRPYRLPRGRISHQAAIVQAVSQVWRRLTTPCGLLALADADDDCPAELGPRIYGWITEVVRDVPVAVVLANREYEAWFLAAAESLRGHRGLAADLIPPDDPEGVAGAKEWLTRRMPRHQPYSPMRLQASFTDRMDLELARQRSPAFDKLWRDVEKLVTAMQAAEA